MKRARAWQANSLELDVPPELVRQILSFVDVCGNQGPEVARLFVQTYPRIVMDAMFGTDRLHDIASTLTFMDSKDGKWINGYTTSPMRVGLTPATKSQLESILKKCITAGYDLVVKTLLEHSKQRVAKDIHLEGCFKQSCAADMQHMPRHLMRHHELFRPGEYILATLISTERQDMISKEFLNECGLDTGREVAKAFTYCCYGRNTPPENAARYLLQTLPWTTPALLHEEFFSSEVITACIHNLPVLRYILDRPQFYENTPSRIELTCASLRNFEGYKELDNRRMLDGIPHPASKFSSIGVQATMKCINYPWKSTFTTTVQDMEEKMITHFSRVMLSRDSEELEFASFVEKYPDRIVKAIQSIMPRSGMMIGVHSTTVEAKTCQSVIDTIKAHVASRASSTSTGVL